MNIAIIGAGIAGLTCAYELTQQGFDVEVLEKESRVGGRMLTKKKRGLEIDIGANYFNNDVTQIPYYCKKFGVPFKKEKKEPTYTLYHGKWYSISGLSILKFPALSTRDIMKVLSIRAKTKSKCGGIYDLSETSSELDYPNSATFAKGISTAFRDYLVDPGVTGLCAHRASELTTSMILNSISRPLRSALGDEYYIGTMNTLPNAFAKRVRVKKKTVHEIVASKTGLRVDDKKYDLVVLTCPQALKYSGSAAQNKVIKNLKYSQTIALTFEAPADLIGFFDLAYIPYVENKKISLIVNGERKHTYKGRALLGIALHEDFAKSVMKQTDTEIFRLVRNELESVAPFLQGKLTLLKNHVLHRWNPALVKYYPRYVSIVRKFWTTGQGDNNVYFCGDFMNAPGVEGSIRSGQKVAKMIADKYPLV
jgi:protoporphyrinogen oxidase